MDEVIKVSEEGGCAHTVTVEQDEGTSAYMSRICGGGADNDSVNVDLGGKRDCDGATRGVDVGEQMGFGETQGGLAMVNSTVEKAAK